MIRDDAVYLSHILDTINQIEEYVAGFDCEMFQRSRLVQVVVVGARRKYVQSTRSEKGACS